MGILHVRPKWIKQPKRKKKSKVKQSSGPGLRIERNREGILFFRQPRGLNDFITWHIYPSGEPILRASGIVEGRALSPGLFKRLRNGGHLYTGNAQKPLRGETLQMKRDVQAKQSPLSKNPKRQKGDLPGTQRKVTKQLQEKSNGNGRVHVVPLAKQRRPPQPTTLPLQRSILANGNIRKAKRQAERKSQPVADSKASSHRTKETRPDPVRPRIHSGWTASLPKSNAVNPLISDPNGGDAQGSEK